MNREEFYKYVELYHQMKNKKTVRQAPPDDDNTIYEGGALMHHGIIGQKWGVRRFQNPDGSLTQEGIERYYNPDGTLNHKGRKELSKNKEYNNYLYNKRIEDIKNGNVYKDDYIYNKEKQNEMKNRAVNNRQYTLDFLEKTKDLQMDDNTRNKEYAKYLKNPYSYSKNQTNARLNNSSKININTNDYYKQSQLKKGLKKEKQKLIKSNIKSGWDFVNRAIRELGFSKEDLNNLTNSDWDKINNRTREIRHHKLIRKRHKQK